MRLPSIAAASAAALLLAAPAAAETRIFLIDSSDGYGIDRCLMTGDQCGRAAATALCRANAFAKVVQFGRLDPTEVTGGVPGGLPIRQCVGADCPVQVAITCAR
jgi:hypothetical protein